MEDKIFIWILVNHFLADFALQTHEQAINKSSSDKWLLYHVLTYSSILTISSCVIFPTIAQCLIFGLLTFSFHFLTDYVSSRIGKPFWKNNDVHNGFVVVGFDQVLHYLQLYFTIKYLL